MVIIMTSNSVDLTEPVYVAPVKQTETSKKIDKLLNISAFIFMIFLMLAAIDVLTGIGIAARLFTSKSFLIIGFGFFATLGLIGLFNGNFYRLEVKSNRIYNLVMELKDAKAKRNILLFIKENKVLTKGDLRSIQSKMIEECKKHKHTAKKEMFENFDISEEKHKKIFEQIGILEHDIQVIQDLLRY